jgi:spore coat polysaccharide biosynthesis protein SpsF (cytidylyltransferase family)
MKNFGKVTAIIQARMGSSRLPGKVLKDIQGKPMLQRVIERVKEAALVDEVILATTTDTSDDQVAIFAESINCIVFRGSIDDVLDRYYQAATLAGSDYVVRITADCPVMDPAVIDKAIKTFIEGDYDYVSTADPKPTFPDGLDVWVVPYTILKRTWNEAELKSEREHVFPYIYNNPDKFKIGTVSHDPDLSELRWTVDQDEDLLFIRKIYAELGDRIFSMQEVLELLENKPELQSINNGIIRNEGYLKSLEEDKNE